MTIRCEYSLNLSSEENNSQQSLKKGKDLGIFATHATEKGVIFLV